jgi:hypothetical protein
MWNEHRIRGPRTVRGHGGGHPSELFLDPIGSQSVGLREYTKLATTNPHHLLFWSNGTCSLLVECSCDDAVYYTSPEVFGVADVFKGDSYELPFEIVDTADPLHGASMLQQIRDEFFRRYPFDGVNDNINDYVRFKLVCLELLTAAEYSSWDAFASGAAVSAYSEALGLRKELAVIARDTESVWYE